VDGDGGSFPAGPLLDYCVVGAGIVGLATARALLERHPSARLVVLDKEPTLAAHQSSHNSGVVHSGVYYEPDRLKSTLAVAGARETSALVARHGLDRQVCGKLIVATSAAQLARLSTLRERAARLGLRAEAVDATRVAELEPAITAVAGLHLPDVAIVNYAEVAAAIAGELIGRNAQIHLATEVIGIAERPDAVTVSTRTGQLHARRLVVCAGLQADRLARLAGLPIDFQIVPFRGQYYRLRAARNDLVRRLIYPVPDPRLPFLGVHLTRTLDGGVTVGPNAVLAAAREGYRRTAIRWRDVAEYARFPGLWRLAGRYGQVGARELVNLLSKRAYLAACRRYCPELSVADLEKGSSGIRAQAVRRDGTLVDDFLFVSTARMLHVGNAPSPAATAAIPIGRRIADRVAMV
jgi:L-2-hydroxyglutarate oxidase